MILVSGATKTMRKLNDPRLGVLLRPGNGNMPDGRPWAVDNGAFAGFDESAFWGLLGRVRRIPGCLWVTAPDVVADHAGTLALFSRWEPILRALGFPVAFVAQDGARDLPWDRIDCLFIGGTTKFKLSLSAARLAVEAKRRGKSLHVGRVNSALRMQHCHNLGADTFDGTQASMFPDRWIPWTLAQLDRIESRPRPDWRFA